MGARFKQVVTIIKRRSLESSVFKHTSMGILRFIPFGSEVEVEFFTKRKIVQRKSSIVLWLSAPYPDQIAKIMVVDRGDPMPECSRIFMEGEFTANMPELLYWSEIQQMTYNKRALKLDLVNEQAYLLVLQRGSEMDSLLFPAQYPGHYRQIILQMLIPLSFLHLNGFLHGDVKVDNYVNSIVQYDTRWKRTTTYKTETNIFNLLHLAGSMVIKPMLIDFELLLSVDRPQISVLVASLHTRPPELVFARDDKPLTYTEQSEACSFGLAIVDGLMRTGKLACYHSSLTAPDAYMRDVMLYLATKPTVPSLKLAYHFDSSKDLADYSWRLCILLGYPGDRKMMKSPLGHIVVTHKNLLYASPHYDLLRKRWKLFSNSFGENSLEMLQCVLHWKRSERSTLVEILDHPYFQPACKP